MLIIGPIFSSTANQPKTSPNLNFCSEKIAHHDLSIMTLPSIPKVDFSHVKNVQNYLMTDIMEIDALDPHVLVRIEVTPKKQVTLFWIPNPIAKFEPKKIPYPNDG